MILFTSHNQKMTFFSFVLVQAILKNLLAKIVRSSESIDKQLENRSFAWKPWFVHAFWMLKLKSCSRAPSHQNHHNFIKNDYSSKHIYLTFALVNLLGPQICKVLNFLLAKCLGIKSSISHRLKDIFIHINTDLLDVLIQSIDLFDIE